MRIKSIELRNFKRFTELVISDIPETSKLVLLIGSNGSGKSSLFDAFDWVSKKQFDNLLYDFKDDGKYYRKDTEQSPFVKIEFFD